MAAAGSETPSEKQRAQKPSKGRVVLFADPEQPHNQHAAIVTDVTEEGVVHVVAFDPVMGPRNFETKGEGTEPGQWSWPPRV